MLYVKPKFVNVKLKLLVLKHMQHIHVHIRENLGCYGNLIISKFTKPNNVATLSFSKTDWLN